MKTMRPPSYHHNGFVVTRALGHMILKMYGPKKNGNASCTDLVPFKNGL